MAIKPSFDSAPGRIWSGGAIGKEQDTLGLDLNSEALLQRLRFIKKSIFEIEKSDASRLAPREKPGRLQDEAKRIPEIVAILDMGKCMNCGICVDVCPEHAVSMNSEIVIDSAKCNACGTCISVCPNEAISFAGRMKTAVS